MIIIGVDYHPTVMARASEYGFHPKSKDRLPIPYCSMLRPARA
jgi:hypothetical protein